MINCLYIHIPFCKKKCKYCAFCSFELLSYKNSYIQALIKEIKYYYKHEKLKTIYFGGGTPSLLNIIDIEKILTCLNFDCNTQITLEANPYNLTLEKLKELKNLGINRLSLGVQSFDDEMLKNIGRLHNSFDIFNVIENIKIAEYDNFSIDLIYGLPNQDLIHWGKTLNIALKLDIPHISLYGLKIEPNTYFYKHLPEKIADDDAQADMATLANNILKEKYKRYEFSNYAANEKYYSLHNIAYWTRDYYYGFGLSASGFLSDGRYTNTFNLKEYLVNPIRREFNKLSREDEIQEEIFLGLRLINGIDFQKINDKYNIDIYEKYKKQFDKFLNYGFMEKTNNGVKLSEKGILISNEILCEFV